MKQPSPSRRALLVFVAACAGVLAAGMAAVAAAGRFAPGREVTARAALPVRGALGAESADVLFWPEAAWEEYSLTEAARLQEGFDVDWPAGAWLDFAGWNGGAGPLPGSEWHADVPQGRCFFARNVRFAAPMPGTEGPDRALVAEVSAGRRDSGFAVTCRVFADDGYQDLPDDWQAAAVQRCREEVMYLLNLSNDESRAGLYELLNGMFLCSEEGLEYKTFNDPELDVLWQEEGARDVQSMLRSMAGDLRANQRKALQLFHQGGGRPPEDVPGGLLPHQTLAADPMPGEEELALLMNNLELEIQIVPMERQAMVLFSWEKGDVAAYYDPVLDCFSGFSLQR